MTITRAQVETILVKRVGAWLTFVSLDGASHVGSNADLSFPIASALLQLGYSVADVTNVADTDLDDVTTADFAALLAVAELRTLETIVQAYTTVDVKGLSFSESGDQFAARIQAAIARLQTTIQTVYGIGGYSAFSVTLIRTDGYRDLAAEA